MSNLKESVTEVWEMLNTVLEEVADDEVEATLENIASDSEFMDSYFTVRDYLLDPDGTADESTSEMLDQIDSDVSYSDLFERLGEYA